jgi:hypothetical protein
MCLVRSRRVARREGTAHHWGLDIFSIQDKRVPIAVGIIIGVGVGIGIGIDPDTDSDTDTDGNQEQTDRQQPGSRRLLSQTMKKYPWWAMSISGVWTFSQYGERCRPTIGPHARKPHNEAIRGRVGWAPPTI